MPITPTNPFKGRHFPGEVIVLCVRWLCSAKMSVRVEMPGRVTFVTCNPERS